MARLTLLGGPPGVGKTSVLKHLPKELATLDADDFVGSAALPRDQAIEMVKCEALRLLTDSKNNNVLVSWVFARPLLYEPFMATTRSVSLVHLVCTAAELESRLRKRGDIELLDFALDRLHLIESLNFPRIDTTGKSSTEVAALICAFATGQL